MKNLLWCMFASLLILSACDANYCPKNKENAILYYSSPKEMDYQMELARLIRSDSGTVRYLFNNRVANSGKPYLVINVFGTDFCGDLHVDVDNEDEFSLKLQNDNGSSGSTLNGLKIGFNKLGSADYEGMTGISE